MKKNKVKKTVTLAMMGSISYLLMLLNFPFPGFPSFLNVDFSDIPALMAALIFGPVAGILVEFIKNLLDLIMTGTLTVVPIGHIANFLAGILFVLPTYYVFKKINSKKGMTFALLAGTVSMAVVMSVLNYFVFLPAYTFFLGAEAMSGPESRTLVTTAILPFNVIKGLLITSVFMLLFIKLQTWINKQILYKNA
ncbi:ECF transporter S component [Peribacillus muralis]|uniref:ECF transporter S component n=1 Tax=Peribacillus muralis TaxID=264697 RepID=UPI0007093C8D|nr:ECF transporter S component [Peribacillus muralis]MCK1991357.1 ECF transporter S component [Peribacillus muralis]MCK2011911.1 ECF transporter S component [Peribacillus muralis]